jgi:hypothetical protein
VVDDQLDVASSSGVDAAGAGAQVVIAVLEVATRLGSKGCRWRIRSSIRSLLRRL